MSAKCSQLLLGERVIRWYRRRRCWLDTPARRKRAVQIQKRVILIQLHWASWDWDLPWWTQSWWDNWARSAESAMWGTPWWVWRSTRQRGAKIHRRRFGTRFITVNGACWNWRMCRWRTFWKSWSGARGLCLTLGARKQRYRSSRSDPWTPKEETFNPDHETNIHTKSATKDHRPPSKPGPLGCKSMLVILSVMIVVPHGACSVKVDIRNCTPPKYAGVIGFESFNKCFRQEAECVTTRLSLNFRWNKRNRHF